MTDDVDHLAALRRALSEAEFGRTCPTHPPARTGIERTQPLCCAVTAVLPAFAPEERDVIGRFLDDVVETYGAHARRAGERRERS